MESLQLPKVIFGTSGLGNLYTALDPDVKTEIVSRCILNSPIPAVFDSAGKYGAGLALESLGKSLKLLGVQSGQVLISNKLGWLRTELKNPEPTFEPGVWKDLKYDAKQSISYDGILECYHQGNELLDGYQAQLVSVHDPDEYMAAAGSLNEKTKRFHDIIDAYRALTDLKQQGKVKAIGIGAKNWEIILQIDRYIKFDWVMIANSMTVHSHPADLLEFMSRLQSNGTAIINSAVFNAGFLTGGNFYNYREVDHKNAKDQALIQWRERFFSICKLHQINPALACVQFGLHAPGVQSIALNTTNPNRVADNINMANDKLPNAFWVDLYKANLISEAGLSLFN
ncbi:aldo/keto reductase [Mucilaginibacter sp.]